MKKMSREDFDYLVHCAKGYDPFIHNYYYDCADSELIAEKNAAYAGDFDEVLVGYGLEEWIRNFANCGDETESKLQAWLIEMGVEVEVKQEKPKRIWTEDEIRKLVQTNDKVLYGALK